MFHIIVSSWTWTYEIMDDGDKPGMILIVFAYFYKRLEKIGTS